jgi:hypothetical protein
MAVAPGAESHRHATGGLPLCCLPAQAFRPARPVCRRARRSGTSPSSGAASTPAQAQPGPVAATSGAANRCTYARPATATDLCCTGMAAGSPAATALSGTCRLVTGAACSRSREGAAGGPAGSHLPSLPASSSAGPPGSATTASECPPGPLPGEEGCPARLRSPEPHRPAGGYWPRRAPPSSPGSPAVPQGCPRRPQVPETAEATCPCRSRHLSFSASSSPRCGASIRSATQLQRSLDRLIRALALEDVQEFIEKLNARERKEGLLHRQRPEAESKYICRRAASSPEECFAASFSLVGFRRA